MDVLDTILAAHREMQDFARDAREPDDQNYVNKEKLSSALRESLELDLDTLQAHSEGYAIRAEAARRSGAAHVPLGDAVASAYRQGFVAGACWQRAKEDHDHEGEARLST